jgi:hypothetical protein
MTAVFEVQWQHPEVCEVCTNGQVLVSRMSRVSGGFLAEALGAGAVFASSLSELVPCPHCTDATRLLSLLPAAFPVETPGGAA